MAVAAELVVGRHDVGLVATDEPGQAAARPRRGRPARSSADRGCRRCPSSRSRDSRGSPTRSRRGRPSRRSSSPARISPRRRWLSGVSISGTTISPSSPRVQVTRTTRWPAATALAIAPPVPIVSSSGWAWTVIRVGRWPAVSVVMVPDASAPGATRGLASRPVGARPAGRYHRATCPAHRLPARSPACASSTARRSWPGRTARCCSATSAPTSSRSSRPRATRRAAGGRRGSARQRAADGTRTAAYYLAVNRNKRGLRLDLKQPDGAAVLAPAARRAATSSSRTSGSAGSRGSGSTTTTLQRAQPAARPPGDLRLRAGRAGRRPARLRLRDPGRERAHVDHRRPGRRRWRADQGRRRDQRRRQRDARSGRVLAALVGRERDGSPAAGRGPADRRVAAGLDAGQPREPGAERLRRPASRPDGSAMPTRTSSRTRRSPTADGAIAVAVGSERQWPRLCDALGLPGAGRAIRASRRTATGSSGGRSCGRSSPPGSRRARPPTGSPRSTPPRSRAGRSTTSWRRSPHRRPRRSG